MQKPSDLGQTHTKWRCTSLTSFGRSDRFLSEVSGVRGTLEYADELLNHLTTSGRVPKTMRAGRSQVIRITPTIDGFSTGPVGPSTTPFCSEAIDLRLEILSNWRADRKIRYTLLTDPPSR